MLGGAVLCLRKGTELHRLIGIVYVFCLFGVNLTALTIFESPGGFGVFHVLAVFNLSLLLVGFGAAFFRRARGSWIHYHYFFMTWSYVGLCAAAGAEIAVRIPGVSMLAGVALPTAAVTLVGGSLIHLRHRATLERLRSRSTDG
jgi:uncharacterized membrane protein